MRAVGYLAHLRNLQINDVFVKSGEKSVAEVLQSVRNSPPASLLRSTFSQPPLEGTSVTADDQQPGHHALTENYTSKDST
jgi:hypothetical protein